MLIHVRPIAISMAVISFFALSFVGLFNGLAPLTCCKRAFIGAALAYLATALAVNVVNAILTSAIIDRHIDRQKETKRVS
jgi:type III secretory pathway component EscU